MITITSFGHKYGKSSTDTTIIFDIRHLPNPSKNSRKNNGTHIKNTYLCVFDIACLNKNIFLLREPAHHFKKTFFLTAKQKVIMN